MKANELIAFEKEVLEFAKGVEKSSRSFFKLFVIASKVILSLVNKPTLRKQISPDRFEEVHRHVPVHPLSLK